MDVVIDAQAQSFDAIFRRDVRYVVPVFQRRYAWERERQWEPFWGDVLEVVEAYVEAAQATGQAPRGEELPVHFLGAIVVKLLPFGAGQVELREVIDGQQRLTTIQLLIGAAASALAGRGAAGQAEVLRDLIENRPYLTKGEPDATFKVWPTKHDRAAFRAVMTNADVDSSLEAHRVVQAFRFFEVAVGEWANAVPESDRELHFQALEAVLRSQLHIVWIDLDNRDNAQVIFETLNDRGAPLNAIDLVKNLVFQHQHGGDDAEELYEQHWAWIEDDWWQRKIRLGRLDRVRADVFLQHWLQMRLGKEVNSDYLFKSFATMLEADAPDVKSLIPEFAEDARLYRSFFSQGARTLRGEFFARLATLNTTTPFPLILLLFKQPATVLSADEVDRSLAIIENYLVRRMLARGTAQGYNRLFTELVRDVKETPGMAPEVIEDYLGRAEGASRRWPRDTDLLPILTGSRAYGSGAIARHRLLDVLWEVERRRLRSAKHEALEQPSGLQIEHVMPQSWKKNWPLPATDGQTPDVLEAAREVAVNRLGNLTLVTEKLNPALSNTAWETKRAGLAKHSLLAMNQQLVDGYPLAFDEGAISQRGEQVAAHILAIWPGPSLSSTA
ncbi:MAG TPA: DUF262 domain-containing protein [Solirubrobacteraceae bacterium]|nr:DUF262 domain-containing protein [Solirubrobacteraceae bacterium]